ncbi:BZIP domain-containing protein [Fusarium falciforme]|uniref:BZIP domain-containing protein n=1 Tax=Fusarium falciforme TaxID=195108 RepID=UPI002301CD8A|nr:BZIP domain-containing protein [Fusarium falciforme]WAO87547.1 BZIP domain-containing protein [Fusarium falciforme]
MENGLHYTIVHGAPPMDHLGGDITTNNFDALPNIPQEQWWTVDAALFPPSSGGLNPAIHYHQGDLPYNDFAPNYGSEWRGFSSVQEYPAPSASDSSYLEPSPSVSSRRSSASAQQDDKRRKQSTAERATAKSAKRPPSARKNKPQGTAVEGKKDSKSRKAQQSKPTIGSSPEDADEYSKRVQERNRVASNKFRIKKREDAKKLKTDEEDMERINRDLSSCVADLTLEVYQLKMRLLQHTDCDCALIQNYIANEAQRYIQNLDEKQHEHGC